MKEWTVTIKTEDYVKYHNLTFKLSAIENQIGIIDIKVNEM